MNREITVEYTREFSTSVYWIMWIKSIGFNALIAWAIGALVVLPIAFFTKAYLFYVITIIFIGIAMVWTLLKKSAPHVNKLNAPATTIVKFRFTDLQLESAGVIFSWENIKAIQKYPTVWLIFFSNASGSIALPTKNLDNEIKRFIIHKLKEAKN
jgi:hypothetical protein